MSTLPPVRASAFVHSSREKPRLMSCATGSEGLDVDEGGVGVGLGAGVDVVVLLLLLLLLLLWLVVVGAGPDTAFAAW